MLLVRVALGVVHVGVAAAWLGAMLYSRAVVQPRAERFFDDPDRSEVFAVTLAIGARWKVLGMCAALGVSGVGLVVAELAGEAGRSGVWVGLMVAKAVLLAVAVAVFVHVSWRLWPARIMALPDELVVLQRRFATVALVLTGVVATGLVLGTVADSIR
ncbi:MAG: hypothetical protein KY450_14285 [Actinobacteria bacterium]|nr:hypothetical protein [Actinomycetota bacterium]